MEIKILNATHLANFPLDQVKDIFFEASSIKVFDSNKEKELFFDKWCGQYLKKYPEYFFVALEERKVLGYTCAHPDSTMALGELKVPGQKVFSHLFEKYPLHLHINCHRDSRGKGVGRKLIEAQEALSKTGLHIITEASADNRGFYKKLGFLFEEEKVVSGTNLLFMGKTLI